MHFKGAIDYCVIIVVSVWYNINNKLIVII